MVQAPDAGAERTHTHTHTSFTEKTCQSLHVYQAASDANSKGFSYMGPLQRHTASTTDKVSAAGLHRWGAVQNDGAVVRPQSNFSVAPKAPCISYDMPRICPCIARICPSHGHLAPPRPRAGNAGGDFTLLPCRLRPCPCHGAVVCASPARAH